MSDDPTNYPLAWPVAKPRTLHRQRAAFGTRSSNSLGTRPLTLAEACRRVTAELARLDVGRWIISTNVVLNRDGSPRSGLREPTDPGAAVYFKRKGKPYCLACDRWDRVPDNIAAIAAEIAANRGRERWGVVSLEEAFAGFAALPPVRPWWVRLSLQQQPATSDQLRAAFRQLAMVHHPDRGGDPAFMAELTAAYEEGLSSFAP